MDTLPVIDITALKHVAYVFDALIYYMRSGSDSAIDTDCLRERESVHSWQDDNDNADDDDDLNYAITMETTDAMETVDSGAGGGGTSADAKLERRHPFFQRSDSTLCLGCPPPDPFETPLIKALPLADQPHLLQPNARREDLFGVPKLAVSSADIGKRESTNRFDRLPTHMGLSNQMSSSGGACGRDTLHQSEASMDLSDEDLATPTIDQEEPRRPMMVENNGTSVIVRNNIQTPPAEDMSMSTLTSASNNAGAFSASLTLTPDRSSMTLTSSESRSRSVDPRVTLDRPSLTLVDSRPSRFVSHSSVIVHASNAAVLPSYGASDTNRPDVTHVTSGISGSGSVVTSGALTLLGTSSTNTTSGMSSTSGELSSANQRSDDRSPSANQRGADDRDRSPTNQRSDERSPSANHRAGSEQRSPPISGRTEERMETGDVDDDGDVHEHVSSNVVVETSHQQR